MKLFLKRMAIVLAGVAALCVLTVPFAQPVAACTPDQPALTGKSIGAGKLCCPKGHNNSVSDCIIEKYINPTIKVLALIAGVVVVGGGVRRVGALAGRRGDRVRAVMGDPAACVGHDGARADDARCRGACG